MPKKTSKKVLRRVRAPAVANRRNQVNFVLSDDEDRRIRAELIVASQASGAEVKLGNYAKAALLSYARHREIERKLGELASDESVDSETSSCAHAILAGGAG